MKEAPIANRMCPATLEITRRQKESKEKGSYDGRQPGRRKGSGNAAFSSSLAAAKVARLEKNVR